MDRKKRIIDKQVESFKALKSSFENLLKEKPANLKVQHLDAFERLRSALWSKISDYHQTLSTQIPAPPEELRKTYLKEYQEAFQINDSFKAKLKDFYESQHAVYKEIEMNVPHSDDDEVEEETTLAKDELKTPEKATVPSTSENSQQPANIPPANVGANEQIQQQNVMQPANVGVNEQIQQQNVMQPNIGANDQVNQPLNINQPVNSDVTPVSSQHQIPPVATPRAHPSAQATSIPIYAPQQNSFNWADQVLEEEQRRGGGQQRTQQAMYPPMWNYGSQNYGVPNYGAPSFCYPPFMQNWSPHMMAGTAQQQISTFSNNNIQQPLETTRSNGLSHPNTSQAAAPVIIQQPQNVIPPSNNEVPKKPESSNTSGNEAPINGLEGFVAVFKDYLEQQTQIQKTAKLPVLKLNSFDGSSQLEYPQWKESFKKSVEGASPTEKMTHLLTYTKGEAKQLLSGLQCNDQAYENAWERLDKHYNNCRTLLKKNLMNILSRDMLTKPKDASSLLAWNSNLQATIKNVEKLGVTVGEVITELYITMLDDTTRIRLEDFVGAKITPVKAIEADNFVTKEISIYQSRQRAPHSTNHSQNQQSPSQAKSSSKGQKNHSVQASYTTTDDSKAESKDQEKKGYACFYCAGPHGLPDCEKFALENDKHNALFERKICFYCGRHKYRKDSPCKKRPNLSCTICKGSHETFLHIPNRTTAVTLQSNEKLSLVPTAVVKVADNEGCTLEVRCLIDQASQSSYVSTEIQQQLRLPKHNTRIAVKGINDLKQLIVKHFVYLNIITDNKDVPNFKVKAYVIPKVAGNLPAETIHKPDWMSTMKLADPHYNVSSGVGILLGAEVATKIYLAGEKSLIRDKLLLMPTVFGFLVVGEGSVDDAHKKVIKTLSSYGTFNETLLKAVSDEDINRRFADFFELPEIRDINPDQKAEEVKFCEELFKKEHQRDETGRYHVPIPLIPDNPGLGRSLPNSLRSTEINENKFKKDPELGKKADAFLTEYAELGHMRETTDTLEQFKEGEGRHYVSYLPILRKDSVTTPIRIVFNASLPTSNGLSLNDIMYEGENLLNDICDILIRAREGKVLISADVVQMFRQVALLAKYWHLLRILVRPGLKGILKQFELTTNTYGTDAAPWLAIRVLHQIAEDESTSEEIKRAIKQNFYMDDFLASVDSVEEAQVLAQGVMETLAKGQFPLSKFASNYEEVLTVIPEDKRLSHYKKNTASKDMKLLGLCYDPEADTFSYNLKDIGTLRRTKRGLTSFAARLYDPLNWTLPYKITLRMLVQQAWLEKTDWDDQLSDNINKQFQEILNEHHHLNKIVIPRWIHATKASEIVLIGCCDASSIAKAAMVYTRIETNDGFKISLLAAKGNINKLNTKAVVQSKENTIPKNELESLTMLAELLDSCAKIFTDRPVTMRAYCDNKPAIYWAKSVKPLRTKYQEIRRKKIQAKLRPEQIFYINTKDNPADLASRGCSAVKLVESQSWFNGPDWLQDVNLPSDGVTEIEIPESCLLTKEEEVKEENILDHCNKFYQLIRSIAHIIRWVNYKRSPNTQVIQPFDYESYRPFSSDELLNAKITLIKYYQRLHLGKQIKKLESQKPLNKHHWLNKLSPYLDSNGMLRVGGRLNNAPIPENAKHPIIIPNCKLAWMIIEYVHLHDSFHLGESKMLQSIIAVFYIPRIKSLIHRCVSQCISCIRWRGRSIQPIMGQLPECRVTPAGVFEYIGCDLCGPFSIKASFTRTNKTMKVWIVSFVCMSTKAYHLEIVSGLSTEDFLAALDRLTGRRGPVKQIWSDNGTNLKGAARVIHAAWSVVLNQCKDRLASKEISWIFIPRNSPQMGGIWEISIKAVKTHLNRLTSTVNMNYEELSTSLCKIEAILNSRPLMANPIDATEDLALTPFHFIAQRAFSVLPTEASSDPAIPLSRRYRMFITLQNQFVERYLTEYLTTLQKKSKWTDNHKSLVAGEVVLIKDINKKPSWWKMGIVEKTYPDKQGVVRQALVKTKEGTKKQMVANLVPLVSDKALEDSKTRNQIQPIGTDLETQPQSSSSEDESDDHNARVQTPTPNEIENPTTDSNNNNQAQPKPPRPTDPTTQQQNPVTVSSDPVTPTKSTAPNQSEKTPSDENTTMDPTNSTSKPTRKKSKRQETRNFDPITPVQVRRSARIKNKLTAKQVLMTWFTILTVSHGFELSKLSAGLHVYKTGSISLKATDWSFTYVTGLNVTKHLTMINDGCSRFTNDCDTMKNNTEVHTACLKLINQVKKQGASACNRIKAIYSPRKRRYTALVLPLAEKALTVGLKYGVPATLIGLTGYQTYKAVMNDRAIKKLNENLTETNKNLKNTATNVINLTTKGNKEITDQLYSWKLQLEQQNLIGRFEASYIVLSEIIQHILTTHEDSVTEYPIDLIKQEFSKFSHPIDVREPDDWEATLKVSSRRLKMLDQMAAISYSIPIPLKENLTVYDIISVASNNAKRRMIPTEDMGISIAVSPDNSTYFRPIPSQIIVGSLYEIRELIPLTGCLRLAINPMRNQSKDCVEEVYDNNGTSVHQISTSTLILQIGERDNTTLIICENVTYWIPPAFSYHINYANCNLHNEHIPTLYALAMESKPVWDSLNPLEMDIPEWPSLELKEITMSPEYFELVNKTHKIVNDIEIWHPNYLYPSSLILLIIVSVGICYLCFRKSPVHTQNAKYRDWPSPMDQLDVNTLQRDFPARPIVITDDNNQVVRYDHEEARRQGIIPTQLLATPTTLNTVH